MTIADLTERPVTVVHVLDHTTGHVVSQDVNDDLLYKGGIDNEAQFRQAQEVDYTRSAKETMTDVRRRYSSTITININGRSTKI